MHSKFYQPDERRAEKVRELFATIARRYDLLNDLMSAGLHRRWKRRLVQMAGHPRDVLDVCCGTGDIAFLFAQTGARVTGVDFATEMLRVAQARRGTGTLPVGAVSSQTNSRAGRPCHLTWLRTDALRLPFADNSFDVVSIGFGLRNLAALECGLCEIFRVLRPGGKLLSLDFGKPDSPALRSLYFGYLRTVLPILGRMFCGDPDTYGYILASLKEFPAQRGTQDLMQACGYTNCGYEEFCAGTMAINYGSKPAAHAEIPENAR